MPHPERVSCTLAAVALLAWAAGAGATADDSAKNKRPSLALRVTPAMAMTPARVRASAEVRGGADDFEDYYCPALEWDWGDDTTSEASRDCEPYEAGTSTIERRYSAQHTYYRSGVFKVTLRLKQKDDVVGATSVNVQVRPGLGDRF